MYGSWDSIAGTVTMLRSKDYPGFNSLYVQTVYTSPEFNRASSSVATGSFSSQGKAASVWEWWVTSTYAVFKNEKSYISFPYMPSLHGQGQLNLSQQTKTRGPQLMANWNIYDQCAACHYVKMLQIMCNATWKISVHASTWLQFKPIFTFHI